VCLCFDVNESSGPPAKTLLKPSFPESATSTIRLSVQIGVGIDLYGPHSYLNAGFEHLVFAAFGLRQQLHRRKMS